jgi:hypothetical protein
MEYMIQKELKNAPRNWTYDRILAKVQKEVQDSENYTQTKREKKRDQLKLYVNQEKAPERISDNTLYTSMQAWMATTTSDQKSVTWLGREWMDEDIAENLNHLAKYDWDEMQMPEKEIKRRFHEWMFGVSILIKTGWKNKTPTWSVRDPLSWLPDKKGWLRSGNFGYMYWDTTVPAYTLKEEDGYFNLDIVEESARSNITIRNEIAYAEPRQLQSTQIENDGQEEANIIDWYTRINGVPYVVTLCSGTIIRFEQIKPVTKAEKEDPTSVEFPVVLRYFSPLPNDPFGISLADLCEDQQTAMTILKNLKLIKEKDLALGDTFLVSNRVKNRTDLLKAPSLTQRRFVSVDGDVNNVIAPIAKNQWSSDWYNFEQQLRSDVQLATGISNVQAGVTEDTKRTASEIQAAQRNANARFLLWFQIQLIADKDFWKLWYRCYREYMKETDDKFVRITTGMTPKQTTLKRKDIASIEDPDVVLDSEENIKRIHNDIRDAWMASYNFYMQDTTIPEIAKALFKRKYYQIVLKISKEEAYQKIPPSASELTAWEDVKAINKGEMIYPEQWDDDYTFLMIYQSAEDSKEKWASIEMRKLAIIMKQVQASAEQGSQTGNQVQAQVQNNMMTQSNQPQNQNLSLNQ